MDCHEASEQGEVERGRVFVCVLMRSAKRELVRVLGKNDNLWVRSVEVMKRGRCKVVVIKNSRVSEEYMRRKLVMCESVRLWRGASLKAAVEEMVSKGYVMVKQQSSDYIEYKKSIGLM